MSTEMPTLTTARLIIRPFVWTDLDAVDRVLSEAWQVPRTERAQKRLAHERWLSWSIANYEALANLSQPPYGDRAVVRVADGRLVGSVGLVPSLGPFGQLPGFPGGDGSPRFHPEVGLYWAIDPPEQRRGYATESARALIEYAFGHLTLARIVATTEFSNERSMGVMRKLGMQVLRNPQPEPPWFQVVGVLENPSAAVPDPGQATVRR
jgi:RimJ/RimL family protein N-acetyltransferase